MKCRNYAHRGFSGRYPENTLLAFRKALEAGCEGMEFDVHLTKDNRLVIIHDEAVDRTSRSHGLVKDMTYEELRRVDVSYPEKFGEQFSFQQIPSLEEYLELVKNRDIISNIELKTGVYEYPGIEQLVLEKIREFHVEDRVILSSFNHHSILRMKALAPQIPCGFLSETWILNPGSYVKDHGAEAYHPQFHMLTDPETRDLKAHGCRINTWTVNEPEDIREMIRLEVDGIISNFPDRVRAELQAAGLRSSQNPEETEKGRVLSCPNL